MTRESICLYDHILLQDDLCQVMDKPLTSYPFMTYQIQPAVTYGYISSRFRPTQHSFNLLLAHDEDKPPSPRDNLVRFCKGNNHCSSIGRCFGLGGSLLFINH